MDKARRIAAVISVVWLLVSVPASGNSRLSMRLLPAVSVAPGLVTVLVVVEAHADNRALEVVAENAEFRRSSQISLDGARAPRINTFEFRGLPTGYYEVTGTLADTTGPRATVVRTLVVAESRGSARPR
jgi:hypothetical protein